MRVPKLVIPLVVAALALAGCGSDDNNDDAAGGSDQDANGAQLAENTGTVNLMSAGEPEETDAYQKIFDDLINSETDYKVEVESVGSFEEQFQIRAEGGTLDVAAAPQPGALAALVQSGSILALEDLGIDVEQLKQTVGESFVELGEVDGKHYGVPTNVNLKSMIWY
ncbi:MAG TPA: extracellular solute-binding protein, partial [Acidimicrobiia bacterium]|nr:extracellular solute-binding protein [Acidimicrobiia bacterium]